MLPLFTLLAPILSSAILDQLLPQDRFNGRRTSAAPGNPDAPPR
jgi:hypothetical protein